MREELTRVGVKELKTPALVDSARPGIVQALQHVRRPHAVGTVFAGGDIDATERARSYFQPYPPSSPSVALLREGQLVYMLERRQIENQTAAGIAQALTDAFEKYCM